ncbi:hypothetical protein [Yaniella halotolerans]|uniref:hypothetical protein n=1 Tax=Yaniella halotolerans TaxID=225453 RepID=UPI0003B5245D|nr:hypothetical protein [Yaniella halotolerans]
MWLILILVGLAMVLLGVFSGIGEILIWLGVIVAVISIIMWIVRNVARAGRG